MISHDIEIIKSTKRLPKDELDNFWDNFYGSIPVIIFFIVSLASFFVIKTTPSAELYIWALRSFGLIFFVYTVYAKVTERNLELIKTRLNIAQNENLIDNLANQENLVKITNKEFHHSFLLPFSWSYGFKLTLIPTDHGILFNFRNRGSVRGRMP